MTKPRTRIARKTRKSVTTTAEVGSGREMRTRTRTRTDSLVETKADLPSVDEYAHVLSPVEREIMRLVVVERVDVHECAGVLNQAQATEAWDAVRVSQTLARARGKLQRAGELEAAKPDALVAQETRERYDDVLRRLRRELTTISDAPVLAGVRAKLLKTIAECERMRDDALQALDGKPQASANAIVYVSHLRDGGPNARDANGENARVVTVETPNA